MGNRESSVLRRIVEDKDWGTVLHLLQKRIEHTVEEHNRGVDVFIRDATCSGKTKNGQQWWYYDIIPYCNSAQLETALTRAVTEKWWDTVLHFLKKSTTIIAEKRKQAVEVFIREAPSNGDSWEYHDIIPHCNSDQLNIVLTRLWTERGWDSFLQFLKKNTTITAEKRQRVVDVFVHDAPRNGDIWKYHDIIPYCKREQLDIALNRALAKKWWNTVIFFLKNASCSAEKCSNAVDVFLCKAPLVGVGERSRQWHVELLLHKQRLFCDIFPHCNSHQLDRALHRLGAECGWITVLQMVKGCTKEIRSRAIEVFVCEARSDVDRWWYHDIIPQCNRGQLDTALNSALTKEWWEIVDKVLEQARREGWWDIVGKALARGVDEHRHRHVAEEASKMATDRDFECYILPYCSDDQLDAVLTHLVTRGRWALVSSVLERGVTLCYLSDDELNELLNNFMSQETWGVVSKVLARDLSCTKHRQVVKEASKRANDWEFELYILPHCIDNQLDAALTHLVARGLWTSVQRILYCGGGGQRVRAIEIATETAEEVSIINKIIPPCNQEEKARIILPCLIKNRKWALVRKIVCESIASALCHWTTGVDYKLFTKNDTTDEDFWLIMKHCRVQASLSEKLCAELTKDITIIQQNSLTVFNAQLTKTARQCSGQSCSSCVVSCVVD